MPADEFMIAQIISMPEEQPAHPAVALQQLLQASHIHPEVDVRLRKETDQLHRHRLRLPQFKCSGLAEGTAEYFREPQSCIDRHQPAHRASQDTVRSRMLMDV